MVPGCSSCRRRPPRLWPTSRSWSPCVRTWRSSTGLRSSWACVTSWPTWRRETPGTTYWTSLVLARSRTQQELHPRLHLCLLGQWHNRNCTLVLIRSRTQQEVHYLFWLGYRDISINIIDFTSIDQYAFINSEHWFFMTKDTIFPQCFQLDNSTYHSQLSLACFNFLQHGNLLLLNWQNFNDKKTCCGC